MRYKKNVFSITQNIYYLGFIIKRQKIPKKILI